MFFVDNIGIEKKALSYEQCNYIINFFEENKKYHTPGVVADNNNSNISSVDETIKKSVDICRTFDIQEEPEKIIINCIQNFVPKYVKKFDSLDKIEKWSLCNNYNIRRYDPGMAFYSEHCEVHGKGITADRMLTWMIYLNTVKKGGETFFRFQQYKSRSEEGKFLIWPPYWTHPHKGLVSYSQRKYIVTGWFVFV